MTLTAQSSIRRAYYSASISGFLGESVESVLGTLSANSVHDIVLNQRDAWTEQVQLLRAALANCAPTGQIYFEFVVPRLGKRIDVVLDMGQRLLVIEFKTGQKSFLRQDIEQVWDYALDLKNFHESSHHRSIIPLLVVTGGEPRFLPTPQLGEPRDGVYAPLQIHGQQFSGTLQALTLPGSGELHDVAAWERGRYRPTPTIVEAATALYRGHSVDEIARNDAGDKNLSRTTSAVAGVIECSQRLGRKSICLVTGVPGAGKTLVGLDIATRYLDPTNNLHSVYLSGNGPLVKILREALTRDDVQRAKARGERKTKVAAGQAVKTFIQPVHHFRDECLKDPEPPTEHVTIFDEAQRAWDRDKTADFMRRKKGRPDFALSEPEFLISCLDRHDDWAVVVCLIGGGQEINTGEAGIAEWIDALQRSFPDWHVHVSPQLSDSEYGAQHALERLADQGRVTFSDDLHLSVSMRSFRAEKLSSFVKLVLDLERDSARSMYAEIAARYPLVLTRDVQRARSWLRHMARGSERYGLVVSSQAQRLKPHAIDVRSPMDPVHWFLNDRNDVRSSYYLEDVATEFHVQGLELDWVGVVWDGDLRHGKKGWSHHSFVGDAWQNIKKAERQNYLKNAYRVLLTRARQGMVIVVPEGSPDDSTRRPDYYDPTYEYFKSLGMAEI